MKKIRNFSLPSSIHPAMPAFIAQPHPVLSFFGTSNANYGAIADILTSAIPSALVAEEPQIARFNAFPNGIDVDYWHRGATNIGFPLDFFRPYFSTLGPMALCRLIHGSLSDNRHMGRTSFAPVDQAAHFLEVNAIPQILDAKIAAAQRQGSTQVHVTVKSLGIGKEEGELRSIVGMIQRAGRMRTDFAGDICIACIGFDVSISLLCRLSNESGLPCECYYADFRDPLSAPAALAYGRPDITCWRNTHILLQDTLTVADEYERRMLDGMRGNLVSPGALLVDESRRGHARLELMELR